MPQAAVQITLDRSGRARVMSGASEIGQGATTMLAVIASEELGLALRRRPRRHAATRDLCPVDLGAYSSRVTLMAGNACLSGGAIPAPHGVRLGREALGDPAAPRGRSPIAWRSIAKTRSAASRSPRRSSGPRRTHGLLTAAGSYDTPKDRHGDYRGGTIGASPAYSFTAHVVEVEVDAETGVIDVCKVWVAHDCGRALTPAVGARGRSRAPRTWVSPRRSSRST